MSVNVNFYVLVGANIGVEIYQHFNEVNNDDDAFYNAYEEYFHSRYKTFTPKSFVLLLDYYGSSYLYAGIALDFSDLEGRNFNLHTELTLEEHAQLVEDAKEAIKDILGINSNPKLMVITHYT
jgi:hypothetical protein